MVDQGGGAFSLDNLFFERPIVHKVKPMCQEADPWRLEMPPSFSQIPATQDILKEAESFSFSSLYNFSQKPDQLRPSLTDSVDASVKASSSQRFNNAEEVTEETRDGRCSGPRLGEGFMDSFRDANQCGRGGDETPLDSGHGAVKGKHFTLDFSQRPPLRRSLFKPPSGQVLHSGGDLSNTDDLSGSSPAMSRPQTFLSPVTMVTEPPPFQPPPGKASQSAPRFSPCPPFPLPHQGSSAVSGRPPQKAARAEAQDKGTKRAHVLPMTPQPLHIEGSSESGVLRPVSEIPANFRSIFKEFPFFNYVQSKALDDVLYTAKNFVCCAPTGSGKTVLFELAIIRLLMETSEPWTNVKVVYMAPIKALCSQRFENWKEKFGPLGLSCKELTGDTEIDDFFEIQDAHIITTTPEKWDSMTRKWKDNCLLQLVSLFLIDEVHVVKDTSRGATLEVVVSRMKAVHTYRTAAKPQGNLSMRFVAVSATVPNIADIADWLCDENGPATYLEMDESHRPVKLRKVVLGFPCSPNQTEFKFDLSLNYKMANIIQTYSDQKPTLVFCSTRKGVQQSAAVLAKDARFIMSIEHKQRLMKYANSILDSKLKDLVTFGVGFHHAGVDVSDRKVVEAAFTHGDLPVLFTTSTLAMGVNMPAHLVVIKSTMHYVAGSCVEYSEADMLQMIGRAGRPQFDTSATAVIMTKFQTKDKYMTFLNRAEIIESSLHGHLVEHLNAEIVLQTISDVNMALDWIRSTFLYIRALKNPKHYGFSTDLDRCGIEAKLQELCLKNLNSLSSIGLITMDEDINIKPTEAGRLMARYCVAFDTMKQFSNVVGTETLAEMIGLVVKGKEFMDVQLRVNEKRTLNTLNKDKNRITIRYPMEGKIKSNDMKVNCLIQAQLGSIPIQEFGLAQDSVRVFRNGVRISRCLSEFLNQRSKAGFTALLNSLLLAKCFRAKLWEDSPYVSKQLEKIGLTLSTAMVNAGLTTFNKIEQTNPRELELIVNRHPPFGNQIKDSVLHLPKYEVTLEQLPRYNSATAEIVVTINLKNQQHLLSKRTAPDYHYVTLIIGDSDNNVVFLQKLTDLVLLKSGSWSKKIEVLKASKGEEISVNLISSEYVGLDIQQKFSAFYSGAKRFGAEPSEPPHHTPWKMQRIPGNQRTQTTGQRANPMPQPTAQAKATSATEQDPAQTNAVKRQCNHFCKNKDQCAHDCCKVGVTVLQKTEKPANQDYSFSSYLRDLKNRSDTLTETPVKRLKMKMSGEAGGNLQQFSYKPKEILPSLSRYGGSRYEPSVNPSQIATVDLTGEDSITPQDSAYLEDEYSYDDIDYLDDMCEMVEQSGAAPPPAQTSAAPPGHFQSSSVWRRPGTSFGDCRDLNPVVNQNNRTYPAPSTSSGRTVSNQNVESGYASSLQSPSVNFDLGSDWDDWEDFDDESLEHASKTSLSICTKTQVQQAVGYNVQKDCATKSAPLPTSLAQAEPRLNTANTPLRLISPPVTPAIRGSGTPSLTIRPQKRLTRPWDQLDNKAQSIFSPQLPIKAPESLPVQNVTTRTPHCPQAKGFDFFSNSGQTTQSSSGISRLQTDSSSKEEEAFLGIFDGIF